MDFSLEVMDEESVREEVKQELAVSDERLTKVSNTANARAEQIFNVNLEDFAQKQQMINVVSSLGMDTVKQSGEKCALLKTRVGELSKAGGESGEVAKNYKELVVLMKELDPKAVDFGAPEGGLLKKIINPVRKYFAQYERADKAIADIVKSINNGIKVLQQDNVTLGLHQQDLRTLTKQLIEQDKMAEGLDTYLTQKLEEYKMSPDCDEERVRFVEGDILYNLRQNRLTYGQMIAVNEQSFLTDETIRRGNVELIRSAQRARDVSVAALQTGAVAAAALYHQKVMLTQIDALNSATNNMIASVADMLKTQGRDIAQKSMSTNIDIDVMKQAFADVYETYEVIDNARVQALPMLQKSVADFREIAERGEVLIAKIEKSPNRG